MLTANDFDKVRFKRSNIGGYRSEDVDAFIDEAKESYEKLQKDNIELLEKLKILAKKIGEYKDTEESLHVALVKAQKLADDSIKEAKLDAQQIIFKAQNEAEKVLSGVKNETIIQQNTLNELKKKVKEFRSSVLSMYKEHIKLVNDFTAGDRISEEKLESMEKVQLEEKKSKAIPQNLEIGISVEPEHNKNKFKDLKFGEDYDLTQDNSEPPIGLFNQMQ